MTFLVTISRKKRLAALILFLFVLLGLGGAVENAYARGLAVVANGSFPVKAITIIELKDIYLGKKQMISGVRLKPVDQDLKQGIRRAFLGGILNMNLDAYIGYWNSRLYQEAGIPPTLKKNSDEVITHIEMVDGAIGYVWIEEAKAAQDRVKILFIIDLVQ